MTFVVLVYDNRYAVKLVELSQAARQGAWLSRVNGVLLSIMLKHETSTLRQSHNFISIDLA